MTLSWLSSSKERCCWCQWSRCFAVFWFLAVMVAILMFSSNPSCLAPLVSQNMGLKLLGHSGTVIWIKATQSKTVHLWGLYLRKVSAIHSFQGPWLEQTSKEAVVNGQVCNNASLFAMVDRLNQFICVTSNSSHILNVLSRAFTRLMKHYSFITWYPTHNGWPWQLVEFWSHCGMMSVQYHATLSMSLMDQRYLSFIKMICSIMILFRMAKTGGSSNNDTYFYAGFCYFAIMQELARLT